MGEFGKKSILIKKNISLCYTVSEFWKIRRWGLIKVWKPWVTTLNISWPFISAVKKYVLTCYKGGQNKVYQLYIIKNQPTNNQNNFWSCHNNMCLAGCMCGEGGEEQSFFLKWKKIVVNPHVDALMLKFKGSFFTDMAFKLRHGEWHIRSRFRLFCAQVKLVLWLQQRFVKTQRIMGFSNHEI